MTATNTTVLRPGRILIVDDDPRIRCLLRDYLEEDNHTVLEAEEASYAMETCANNDVDLVITDLEMPRIHGSDFLRQLKDASPHLPVIIITGKGSVEAAVLCLKLGAVDFVEKPIDFDKLSNLVNSTLVAIDTDTASRLAANQRASLEQVGGYRLGDKLGTGSFGDVFLTSSPNGKGDTEFAIKVFRAHDIAEGPDVEHTARFLWEAEAASRVQHPNIVRIYDYGWDEETNLLYLVMEYVEGRSLKDQIIESTPRSHADCIHLVLQVARALEAIHSHNILHRDVKPHNVLVTSDMQAKLTDFGIVKMPESRLTNPASLLGTPAYMSPEALRSENVDSRADLFSLGVLAYELSLGRLPFKAEALGQVALAVVSQRPDEPRKIDRSFPRSFQRILGKMMKKSVQDRYQSATDLISDLEAFLAGAYVPQRGILKHFREDILAREWS